MEHHGSKNRKPPETGREDELGEGFSLLPSDVARRVFGTNSGGITDLKDRQASAKAQRQAIVMASLLPVIPFPRSLDAKGTEHAVRFRGKYVEKHQHSDGWQRVPMTIQNLPIQLMGSAWWHDEEGLVLLDARKPNFKKTDFGALPIDLILGDLSPEMHDRLISNKS